MLHLLDLLVQGLAAPGYAAEVPLNAHVLLPGAHFGVFHYALGQTGLARHLEGERVARQAHFQLEERLDAGGVELHRTVHDACPGAGSVEFEVGVVRGDYPVHATAVQFRQDCLRNGSSRRRLGAAAELVDQHQRTRPGVAQHRLHLLQERRIRGEVVLQALVVAYREHNLLEHRQFGSFGGGHKHAPLEHVLQQSGGLEAHALAPGVGAGDEQDVLFGIQLQGNGNHLPAFPGERLLQQRMTGLPEHQPAVVRNHRHAGGILHGRAGLGHYEVEFSHELRGHQQIRHVRPQEVGKLYQYAFYFKLFLAAEFLDFVFQFHHLQRLHEGGFSGRRDIVDVAAHLALAAGRHRNEVLAVSDVHRGVGIGPTGILGGLEHCQSLFRE